jgi:hypothetical protein
LFEILIVRLTQIFGYIANTVKLVTGLPQDFKPTNSGSLSAVNLLKMNLFDAIRHLPSSILSVPTHRQVINFITKMAFAEADGTISGTITSMLSRITRDEEVSNLLDEIQWQDYKFKLDDQVSFHLFIFNISSRYHNLFVLMQRELYLYKNWQ